MILVADSGSTKTSWALSGSSPDSVAVRIETQGINPFHQDAGEIEHVVRSELLPRLDVAGDVDVYFYGSGCTIEQEPAMESVLRRAIPMCGKVEAHGDLLGAARALCGREAGIACILGTGSNSCYYDGRDIAMNVPALGYILGDEGSGAVLGRMFMNALFKGGLPETIRQKYLAESGLTMADVIRRVYREPLANRFLASVSPFIHANIGEPELKELVKNNFRSFFRSNILYYGHVGEPLGFVGSMAYYYKDLLTDVASEYGFNELKIIKNPLEGLLLYHNA